MIGSSAGAAYSRTALSRAVHVALLPSDSSNAEADAAASAIATATHPANTTRASMAACYQRGGTRGARVGARANARHRRALHCRHDAERSGALAPALAGRGRVLHADARLDDRQYGAAVDGAKPGREPVADAIGRRRVHADD